MASGRKRNDTVEPFLLLVLRTTPAERLRNGTERGGAKVSEKFKNINLRGA